MWKTVGLYFEEGPTPPLRYDAVELWQLDSYLRVNVHDTFMRIKNSYIAIAEY